MGAPMSDTQLTLAIETSCDETAAAVVEGLATVRSSVVASQIDIHRKYGGTVPEIASRHHLEAIVPVIQEAMEEAGVGYPDLTGVAVVNGPGLVGSLLVGLCAAKAITLAHGLPLVGVNHLEAHIYAAFLGEEKPVLPALVLIVSGGHSHLVLMTDHLTYRVLGRTRDDAPGEAFDKAARLLGLGYPGGPIIDELSRRGDRRAIDFPRAHLPGSWDFSFSGPKTALYRYLEAAEKRGQTVRTEDVAASFLEAVVDVLVAKTLAAAEEFPVQSIVLTGGVAANTRLRERLESGARERGVPLFMPPLDLCTDNAAMVGCAAAHRLARGLRDPLDLDCYAMLPL